MNFGDESADAITIVGNVPWQLGPPVEFINVYYKETTGCRLHNRAILMDLDLGTVDSVRAGPLGQLFRPNYIVFGHTLADNKFAKDTTPRVPSSSFLSSMWLGRKREGFDSLQGFQLYHSVEVCDTVAEPHNAILSVHQLVENADESISWTTRGLPSQCKYKQ